MGLLMGLGDNLAWAAADAMALSVSTVCPLPNSRVMIHQPLGSFQGQSTDFDIQAKEILSIRSRLNEILSKHTGQTLKKIQNDTERDNFMTSSDALKYGIIDEILESR